MLKTRDAKIVKQSDNYIKNNNIFFITYVYKNV